MADVNDASEVKEVTSDGADEKNVANGGSGDNLGETPAVEEVKKPVIQDLEPEVRAKKIKRQIEYYFGDFNMPTDKFLREQVKENDGWVTLETMLKFRRLASLTDNPTVVVEAMEGSEIVQINEEKTALRRNPDKPLPEENESRRKEVLQRSVYVKGFPTEGFTIDNALDFFEQFGPADDIVLRYWQDKAAKKWLFKGSVFVKYPSKDAAAAFLALDEVKYNDTPLEKMWQEEFIEKKRKERLEQKINKRKHPDGDDGRKDGMGDKSLPKGATLHMTKCPDGLTREVLKERLEEDLKMTVAFINYSKGDEEGYIRLHEEGAAAKVMEHCEDGKLKLKDDLEVELKPLEGEEETTFLEEAKQSISDRRNRGKQNQRGRRGGRGGGRGGGNWRKRRYDDGDGQPKAKVSKADGSDGE